MKVPWAGVLQIAKVLYECSVSVMISVNYAQNLKKANVVFPILVFLRTGHAGLTRSCIGHSCDYIVPHFTVGLLYLLKYFTILLLVKKMLHTSNIISWTTSVSQSSTHMIILKSFLCYLLFFFLSTMLIKCNTFITISMWRLTTTSTTKKQDKSEKDISYSSN